MAALSSRQQLDGARACARPQRRVVVRAATTYQAPSTATGANELQALARLSNLVPDTLMGTSEVRPKAATVSSLLLSWVLANEQLGMKPYQVRPSRPASTVAVLLPGSVGPRAPN